MSLLSLFGFGNNKIKEALQKGAVVIDVRTAYEFDLGHVPHSINIPVNRISSNIERIKDIKKPVIFCCASGARSGQALQIMKSKGLTEVHNGGSWENVIRIYNKL